MSSDELCAHTSSLLVPIKQSTSRSPTPSPIPDTPNTYNTLEPEKQFILTLETLPVLWNKTNPYYSNKYMRHEALKKLLKILKQIKPKATIVDVKKKINTLRTNYRRELRKQVVSERFGGGPQDVYTPKSWTFQLLHFLYRYEQPVFEIKELQDSEDSSISERRTQLTEEESNEDIKPFLFSTVVDPPKPLEFVALTKPDDLQQKQNEPTPAQPCSCQQKKSSTLAMYWTEKIEKLNNIQRIYAEKAINDVLFEAELGNLQKHSVKINETK